MNNRSNPRAYPGAPRLVVLAGSFTLLFAAMPALQAVTIESEVRDLAGKPVTELLVHARPGGNNGASPAQTRTDAAGRFRFVLPDGDWQVQIDPSDLIVHGFFCAPMIQVCDPPGDCPPSTGWPPFLEPPLVILFQPGGIEITPITVAPLLPTLAPPRVLADGRFELRLTFDTTTEPLLVVRDYQVEVSENLIDWKPLQTVSLTNSPITLRPTIPSSSIHYLRAVSVEIPAVPSP